MPDTFRGRLWIKLLEIDGAMAVHSDRMYWKLIDFDNDEAEDQIDKDLGRTLPDLKLWREDYTQGNNKLFNVLKAYSNYDNEVGYV